MLPPRDPLDPPLFPEAGPSSPNRPSIFELLAEDQLRDLFHPVVRYVLSVSLRAGSRTCISRVSESAMMG